MFTCARGVERGVAAVTLPRKNTKPWNAFREVRVRQVRHHVAVGEDRRQDLAGAVGGRQPVAVLGENRRRSNRVVHAEPDKPAQEQVAVHLLDQLPFRPDRQQDLDQAGAQQSLRRDLRPPLG